ncbi:MAG: hypothetical protein FD138_2907 [Planctomycetota bacterium]|nr:MAG: hypothetical protein FD138_2907 [Planctomycetota bacterium]
MHCRRFVTQPQTRRSMLQTCANGFGAVALSSLLNEPAFGAEATSTSDKNPFAARKSHFDAKAKSVIFLYMDGGVSQVDSFDPKPRLDAENGKPFAMKIEKTQFNNNGNTLASPWKFKQYGESGIPVSDLFPFVGQHADKLAVVRSLTSAFPEHTNANYFLHTGHGQQGRPSTGAWVGYGLGSECQDLPGFVVLNGGLIPPGGLDNFNSGFLPASFQASVLGASDPPVANIKRAEPTAEAQQRKLDLMRRLDRKLLEQTGPVDALESAIANYELAARMQMAVPELMDLSKETEATQKAYGLQADFANTRTFGRICLLARRLVERGVRFIELTCPGGNGDRWDQHSNLKDGHTKNALTVDQPIGALLADLAQRGLLDNTLVVWAGEFGRTPFAQGSDGRDHNPFAYSVWLAGGGIKGGTIYGMTDEYGYKCVENRLEMHDLHATMLHLLGIDHLKLTYRFSGRDMRLTDVSGHVVKEILA